MCNAQAEIEIDMGDAGTYRDTARCTDTYDATDPRHGEQHSCKVWWSLSPEENAEMERRVAAEDAERLGP